MMSAVQRSLHPHAATFLLLHPITANAITLLEPGNSHRTKQRIQNNREMGGKNKAITLQLGGAALLI